MRQDAIGFTRKKDEHREGWAWIEGPATDHRAGTTTDRPSGPGVWRRAQAGSGLRPSDAGCSRVAGPVEVVQTHEARQRRAATRFLD